MLKEAINLMLEIYGCCYIFDGEIHIDKTIKRSRRNWECLPPGERPSRYVERQLRDKGQSIDTFEIFRLRHVERYSYDEVVVGINGFNGYFAYLFSDHCVFESAHYGNATYIVPRENWEELSQRKKSELFYENMFEEKIIHTGKWCQNLDAAFRKYGIKLQK